MSDSNSPTRRFRSLDKEGQTGSTAKYPVLVRPVSGCLIFGNTADEMSFDNGLWERAELRRYRPEPDP